MNKDLILITETISFKTIIDGKVSPIEVYKEQMDKWLFLPVKYLAEMHTTHKEIEFSHGYSVFALELLFFEPHAQYLNGNNKMGAKKTFDIGFNRFVDFLLRNNYMDADTKKRMDLMNFYNITRCGIYHSLTIKSKVLIDSRKGITNKVFANSSVDNGLFVYPWNFIIALESYFAEYIKDLEKPEPNLLKSNFQKTFNNMFAI